MANDITTAMDSVRDAFLEAERNGRSAKELEKMQAQYKDAINAHLNDRADQIALVKVDQFWERSSSQHEPTMKDFETFRDTMPQELSERASVRDWLHKKEIFLETGMELNTRPYERSSGLSTELPRDVIDTIWNAGTMDELQSIGSNLSSAVDQTAEIEIQSVKEFEALKEVAREWSREEHQESLDDLRDFRNGLDPEVLQYESVKQYLNDQYDFIYYQPEHVVQTVIQIDNQQEMDSFKDRMKAYEMEHAGLVHISDNAKVQEAISEKEQELSPPVQGREGFEYVDIFAYVQQLQEQGALTLDAQKTGPVIARKVEQEMELEVYTKNGNLESVETAKPSEILLTRADEHGNPVIDDFGHTNTWKVSQETFEKRYDIENMREDGFANPKFAAQTFIQVDRDVSIEAPWGGTQEIKAGGFLNITDPEKDLYGIAQEEFAETYMVLDGNTHDHSAEEYDFNHDYAKFASEHEAYSPDKDYSRTEMVFSKNPIVQEICEDMEDKVSGNLSDMSKDDVLFLAIRNGDIAIDQIPMDERTPNVYAAALVQEPEIYEELNEEISPMMNAEIVEVLSERTDVSRSEMEDILEHIEEYSYVNQIESGLDLSDKLRDSIEASIPEVHSIDEPEHQISFSLDGDEH